jgi:hypothetical protein
MQWFWVFPISNPIWVFPISNPIRAFPIAIIIVPWYSKHK